MKRVKARTFCGSVCYQEVYNVKDGTPACSAKPPKPRFENEAQREAHREAISKKNHTMLVNANFTHKSLYSTFTYDDKHLPGGNREGNIHRPEDLEESERIMKKFIRRCKTHYPDAVIDAVSETRDGHRLHIHMLSNGIPGRALQKLWKHGEVSKIEHLRRHNFYGGIDCGEDFTGLAEYLFKHSKNKAKNKRRYYITKNAKKPERETPRIAKRNYSEDRPPAAPKGYRLVFSSSNAYGYMIFKYVADPKCVAAPLRI